MFSINLVNEAHKSLSELSKIRNDFHTGKVDIETAKQSIGFFNATSRALGVAINAEKWTKSKAKTQKNP